MANEKHKEELKKALGINPEMINKEFPCQSLATAEMQRRAQRRYKPDPDSFNAFIEYLKNNPGEKATYEDYKKFKKEREGA